MSDELIGFLRARYDEDEAVADDEREVDDIVAKRGVVREVEAAIRHFKSIGVRAPSFLSWVLMHLAGPYVADRDYRPDWSID